MKLTEAQRRHLEWLDGRRPHHKQTASGYWCRTHGLSEWLWEMSDGSEMPNSETRTTWPGKPMEVRIIREILTDAGRLALETEGKK